MAATTTRAISAVLPGRCLVASSNSKRSKNATNDRLRRGSRARRGWVVSTRRAAVVFAGTAADSGLPSLDASSTWRLHFDLFSGKNGGGGSQTEPDRTVSVTAKFVVDEGYEPPQGVLKIVSDDTGLFADGGLNRWTLEVGSRWIVLLYSSTSYTTEDCFFFGFFLLLSHIEIRGRNIVHPAFLTPRRIQTSAKRGYGSGVFSRNLCILTCYCRWTSTGSR